MLIPGWTASESPGIWSIALSPRPNMPNAGFKIHLSSTLEGGKSLLQTVVPIFLEAGVCFRFLVDEKIHYCRNSHFWDRGSSGKFITAYPPDLEKFKRLLERLYIVTRGFEGPYILSDKRYKDSKVLFYCYGSFRPRQRVTIYGERLPVWSTPDGREVPDLPAPYFELPFGVTDPFPDDQEDSEELILKKRYKVLGTLSTSNKGCVYHCIDLQTNKEVVVKESRPFVTRGSRAQVDAVDCLRNEYRVLKLLEGTGLTPRPIEFFQEWEHCFLAMELAAGEPLSPRLLTAGGPTIMEKNPNVAEVRRYGQKFLTIAKKLVAGLRAIHQRGVVIQDISPNNILFDPQQGKLTFIDFEAAYCTTQETQTLLISLITRGFGAVRKKGDAPTMADDYRALSRILGSFLCLSSPFFSLVPDRVRHMLEHVLRDKGLPDAFLRLILGTASHPECVDQLLLEAERSLNSIAEVRLLPPRRQDTELIETVEQIGSYIRAQIVDAQDPLDLPTDYRRFTTNRLSVAYGASGIALFLHHSTRGVPAAFRRAYLDEVSRINNRDYPPGLYVGSSGVAWTLLELGFTQQAMAVMDLAARSPLLRDCADMFYGAAGFGLANLFFFEQLGLKKYLKNALQAFAELKPLLQKGRYGYSYRNEDGVYVGLGHGAAGIGYFVLRLHQMTGTAEHLSYARGLLDFELAAIAQALSELPCSGIADGPPCYPYFQVGLSGTGSVLLRFYATLGDNQYLQTAIRCARKLAGCYTSLPCNFSGMTGIANFFVDMYQYTGEEGYLLEARRFVDRINLFAIEKRDGLVFPGENLLCIATDYATGSCGTGTLIDRLLTHRGLPYLDF